MKKCRSCGESLPEYTGPEEVDEVRLQCDKCGKIHIWKTAYWLDKQPLVSIQALDLLIEALDALSNMGSDDDD